MCFVIRFPVGADCSEGPPVPFPNTEVKLTRVENTWWVTAREDRFVPTFDSADFGLLSLSIPP